MFRKLIDRLSDRQQTKLDRHLRRSSLLRCLKRLEATGQTFQTIYDIGAHKGDWTKEIQSALADRTFVLFEANAEHSDALKQTGCRYLLGPLASESKTVSFYARGGTGDSIFQENTSAYAGIEPISLQACSLDDIMVREALPAPDLIKIDTQGAELEVLAGGAKALAHASAVLMEAPIIQYNKGAPNLSDYVDAMSNAGFLPHELCEIHHHRSVLLQIDILFLRRDLLFDVFPKAREKYQGGL